MFLCENAFLVQLFCISHKIDRLFGWKWIDVAAQTFQRFFEHSNSYFWDLPSEMVLLTVAVAPTDDSREVSTLVASWLIYWNTSEFVQKETRSISAHGRDGRELYGKSSSEETSNRDSSLRWMAKLIFGNFCRDTSYFTHFPNFFGELFF